MRVIPPLEISAARLTAAAVPEPDSDVGEQAFDAAVTYGRGARVILGAPSAVVTISNASPAVIGWAGHGQTDGTPVVFSTTGALPDGLVAGRVYHVRNASADDFQVSAEPAGLVVATSSAGTGVHTATAHVHRTYESLQAGNIGHYPRLAASSEWWADAGPTNRYAMFDTLRNTATLAASPMVTTITPGERVDSLALLGLVAQSVRVQVSSAAGGGEVYDRTIGLQSRDTASWSDYFFGRFRQQRAVAVFDLPQYTDAVITVTLTGLPAGVACGALVLGRSEFLGRTELEAVSDSLNYSTVSRDLAGNAVMTPRRNIPVTRQKLSLNKALVPRAERVRSDLNGVPAVYSALDDDNGSSYFEPFLVLGFARRFLINANKPMNALIELEIEEV